MSVTFDNGLHPAIFPKCELTPFRIETLQKIADGSRLIDIAQETNRAEQTMKNELRVIRDILGADTTCQAVAMAIRRGIIQ